MQSKIDFSIGVHPAQKAGNRAIKIWGKILIPATLVLCAGMVLILFSCESSQSGPDKDRMIQLAWTKPGTIMPNEFFPRSESRKIGLELVDQRADGVRIGHSEERQKFVATKSPLDAVFYKPLSGGLVALGLNIVAANAKDADLDLILRIAITYLFVEETGLYHSKIMAVVQVLDNNQVMSSEKVAGTSNRWGRSFAADNYNEAITNSMVDLIENIGKNEKLMAALQVKK